MEVLAPRSGARHHSDKDTESLMSKFKTVVKCWGRPMRMRAPLGMVHGSGGMMGARAAHLNGLGCHFTTQCKEKSNNADLSKKS